MTPWTVAQQALLFLGFFKQEYWSVLPFPLPGDLPDPGIKPASPVSPALQADSLNCVPSMKSIQCIGLDNAFLILKPNFELLSC